MSCAGAQHGVGHIVLQGFGSFSATARRGRVLVAAVATFLSAVALAIPTASQGGDVQTPAVDGLNAKLSIEGGTGSDAGSAVGLGSVSIPLGGRFAAQFDAAFGPTGGSVLAGGGVHLFARDPSRYLLGVYGSYHQWNDIGIWRAAGEYQWYFGPLSFEGLSGVEHVAVPDTVNGLPVLNHDSLHFFSQADLAWYPTDNLRLAAGAEYADNTMFGTFGAEYLPRSVGVPVSLFVHGRVAGNGDYALKGGVRLFFGGKAGASLITRHRTEDPPNYTPVFPQLQTAAAATTTLCTGVNTNDNNACTIDSCDPTTGLVRHTPRTCNDNNPNTIDTCDPASGCVFTPIN